MKPSSTGRGLLRLPLLAGLLMLTGLACREPTEIMVRIDSDLMIPMEIDTVRLRMFAPGGGQSVNTFKLRAADAPAGASDHTLPLLVGVTPDGQEGLVEFQATALKDSTVVVQQSYIAKFQAQDPRLLPFVLEAACIGKTCMGDETCAGGECVFKELSADQLPKYEP